MMTLNLIPLTGAMGPRGIMGLKGDPGESISIPEAMVSPNIQTVSENQTATFYCSASGNPRPTVTWIRVNGSPAGSNKSLGGKLEITRSVFNDSGEYKCTAVNIMGRDIKTAELIVEGKMTKSFKSSLKKKVRINQRERKSKRFRLLKSNTRKCQFKNIIRSRNQTLWLLN